MISYQSYKILHLLALLLLAASMGVVVGEGRWIPSKKFKFAIALASILIFVAGMGLLARIGFRHGESFPLWLWIKMAAWALFNVLLVMLFKWQHKSSKLILALLCFAVLFVAVVVAVTKLGFV